jgi:hypothetical protein
MATSQSSSEAIVESRAEAQADSKAEERADARVEARAEARAKSRAKSRARLRALKVFVIVAACVAGALCAYLIYAYQHYGDRVPPGTYLAGEDVSGFTLAEAKDTGQKIYDSIVMDLTLQNDSDVTSVPAIAKTLTANDVGIAFDAEATARGAVDAASDKWFITRVNPFVKKDIGLSVIMNDTAVTDNVHN